MKFNKNSSRRKNISLILVLVFSLFIVSCGDKAESKKLNYEVKTVSGIKVFANESKPSIDKIEMNLAEKFTLNGDIDDSTSSFQLQQPIIDIDNEDNIYLIDMSSSSIKKFDKLGNFVSQLGRKGTGPGEFFMTTGMITANDTVYGFDATLKVNKYDKQGNFSSAINILQTDGFPTQLKRAGDKFIGYRVSPEQKDNKIYLNFNLVLMDKNFNNLKDIVTNRFEFDPTKPMNPMDFVTFFAVGANEIYVAEKSTDYFKILVYDFEGTNTYNITKTFRKTKYSKRELDKANKLIEESMKKMPAGTPKIVLDSKFKDAITGMWVDKKGRLWTGTAKEDDGKDDFDSKSTLDVFKDGIFLNEYSFERNSDSETFDFIEDKLIFIDAQEGRIKVYEY